MILSGLRRVRNGPLAGESILPVRADIPPRRMNCGAAVPRPSSSGERTGSPAHWIEPLG